MTGFTVGMLAAPPIGGVLYDRLGFRAPFVFEIIFTAFDFIGRLLVIERKDALKWGHNPALAIKNAATITPADPEDQVTSQDQEIEEISSKKNDGDATDRKELNEGPSPVVNSSKSYKQSELQVWRFMLTSSRTLVALSSVFIYAVVYAGLEPTLSLRLQDLYGFDSTKAGIIILAGAVVSVFASPISGRASDRFGVEWIIVLCLALTIPWYALLIIRGYLGFFIVCFALSNLTMAAHVSPWITELASVVGKVDGIGYGHIYGFFNMAFGIGSAVGPRADLFTRKSRLDDHAQREASGVKAGPSGA